MPTRITQIENTQGDAGTFKTRGKNDQLNSPLSESKATVESHPTLIKVEGTLHLRDAELLEKICRDVAVETGRPVMVNLSNIRFIDSDSASVLCRMKREQDVRLEGLHLFIENVVELAEEANKTCELSAGD